MLPPTNDSDGVGSFIALGNVDSDSVLVSELVDVGASRADDLLVELGRHFDHQLV